MGAPGYFVAAGLFMIAAAIFCGHAMGKSREGGFAGIACVFCILTTLFLLGNGAAIVMRERKKDVH